MAAGRPTAHIEFRQATQTDLDAIKRIADRDKHALGFVHRGALARAIERREVLLAVRGSDIVGFCQMYHRRDGVITVSHIAVVHEARRRGIGRALVDRARDDGVARGMTSIRLKCPFDLPANAFYQGIGFALASVETTASRDLNIWERPLLATAMRGGTDVNPA